MKGKSNETHDGLHRGGRDVHFLPERSCGNQPVCVLRVTAVRYAGDGWDPGSLCGPELHLGATLPPCDSVAVATEEEEGWR